MVILKPSKTVVYGTLDEQYCIFSCGEVNC